MSDGVVEKRGRVWFRVERAFEKYIEGTLTIFFLYANLIGRSLIVRSIVI